MKDANIRPFTSDLAFEVEVITDLALGIDSPRALTVLLLIQYREWDQLLSLEIDPAVYDDHRLFADDYLITKVISKSVNIPCSADKADEALKKFFEGEAMCRDTNDRIESGSLDVVLSGVSHHVNSILGPLRTRDLHFVEDRFRNGPGATFNMTGSGSIPSDKFREVPTLTASLIPFARSIAGPRWLGLCRHSDVVEGNRFTTVPKTAKTDRGICIEPSLNVFAQLGIGALLRARLKSHRIDLNDQSVNQELARNARTRGLATIDLSLASDSVSLLLVYRLLCPEWFELLSLCRSPKTLLPDGTFVPLEKFSSMGNGYTFELESLIFTAICLYAGCRRGEDFHVYGDDIIVPQDKAARVIEVLELLGFKPNRSKTFLAGRFFESCGTDWFDNMPVRPFFLRKSPSDRTPYALIVCNRLRLYAKMRGVDGCDRRYREIWLKYYQRVPKHLRLPVPEEIGDSGVIVSDLEHSCSRASDGHEGHVAKFTLRPPARRTKADMPLHLHHLHSLSLRRGGNSFHSFTLRDFVIATSNAVTFERRIANPVLRRIGTMSFEDDSLLTNHEYIRGYLGKPRTVLRTVQFSDDLRWS